MILNLTQHPASAEQLAAGVVDLPAGERAKLVHMLTVETLPTPSEVIVRCSAIADLASYQAHDSEGRECSAQALIGGAPWMMAELERQLLAVRIDPVYAFSVRESVEQTQADGSVRKVNIFRHAGFIPSL